MPVYWQHMCPVHLKPMVDTVRPGYAMKCIWRDCAYGIAAGDHTMSIRDFSFEDFPVPTSIT